MKRFVSIIAVLAMSLMMVSSAFAAAEFNMGGRADFIVEYKSSEVGDADAVKNLTIKDGGRVQFKGKISKELDNGATAALEGVINIERSAVKADKAQVKYMNGPLTVTMIKASRPGTFKKGVDKYIPKAAGDPGRYQNDWVSEQGICFEYKGEGMTFATTVNIHGGNKIGVRPYVQMAAGAATIRAAVEVQSGFPTNTDADGPTEMNFGAGASVITKVGPAEIGISGTYGVKGGKDAAGDDKDSTTYMSAFVYAKTSVAGGDLGVAGGYNMKKMEDADNEDTGMQVNVGFQKKGVIVPGLKLETGFGYGSAEDTAKVDSSTFGGKVMLRYEF